MISYASELSNTTSEYFIVAMSVSSYARKKYIHRSTTFKIWILTEIHAPSWSGSNENMNFT